MPALVDQWALRTGRAAVHILEVDVALEAPGEPHMVAELHMAAVEDILAVHVAVEDSQVVDRTAVAGHKVVAVEGRHTADAVAGGRLGVDSALVMVDRKVLALVDTESDLAVGIDSAADTDFGEDTGHKAAAPLYTRSVERNSGRDRQYKVLVITHGWEDNNRTLYWSRCFVLSFLAAY